MNQNPSEFPQNYVKQGMGGMRGDRGKALKPALFTLDTLKAIAKTKTRARLSGGVASGRQTMTVPSGRPLLALKVAIRLRFRCTELQTPNSKPEAMKPNPKPVSTETAEAESPGMETKLRKGGGFTCRVTKTKVAVRITIRGWGFRTLKP